MHKTQSSIHSQRILAHWCHVFVKKNMYKFIINSPSVVFYYMSSTAVAFWKFWIFKLWWLSFALGGLELLSDPVNFFNLFNIMKQVCIFFPQQEVRKVSESIKYNHPLRRCVDTILKKVINCSSSAIIVPLGGAASCTKWILVHYFLFPLT